MNGVALMPAIPLCMATPTRASAARAVKVQRGWMEYQGLRNWSGLLDPLDDTLRREILRYGEFVEAAYESFDFKPNSTSYGMSRFSADPTINRPGMAGYRLYHNLVSSSGIRTPSWFECAPGWVRKRSAWIGYIAVSHDREVISRLGRRDVVVAFRGTATCLEWLENLRVSLSPIADPGGANDTPMAASGLLSLYTSRSRWYPSLKDMVRSAMEKILKRFVDEPVSVTVTGHSLGAALALLTAYDITETLPHSRSLVTVMSFGGPRVGNRSFRCRLEQRGVRALRIVNSDDIVTRFPGIIACEPSSSAAPWMRKWVDETRWAYADVGKELRLPNNGYSSCLGVLDLPSCHDMGTYLDLLREFVGST